MRTILYHMTVWATLMLAGLCLLAAMALNVLRFPVPVVARVACLSAKLIRKGNEMVIRRNKGNPNERYV